jgi:hypothetical protein
VRHGKAGGEFQHTDTGEGQGEDPWDEHGPEAEVAGGGAEDDSAIWELAEEGMNREYTVAAEWLVEVGEKYGTKAAIEASKIIEVVNDGLARCDENTREAALTLLERIFAYARKVKEEGEIYLSAEEGWGAKRERS